MNARAPLIVCSLLVGACGRPTPASLAPAMPAANEAAPPAAASATAAIPEPEQGAATAAAAPRVGMGNPASKNCVEKGGKLEILESAAGQYGVCVFSDGSRCEEWRFFRGQCEPGTCRDKTGTCK